VDWFVCKEGNKKGGLTAFNILALHQG